MHVEYHLNHENSPTLGLEDYIQKKHYVFKNYIEELLKKKNYIEENESYWKDQGCDGSLMCYVYIMRDSCLGLVISAWCDYFLFTLSSFL